jgi:hypothetical protein
MRESLSIDSRLLDIVDYSQGLPHSAAQHNPRWQIGSALSMGESLTIDSRF